uniref:Uncharacterized protein n=2 Tax=Ralstonia solanacearum TaxID=305 RepID=A0A0S4V7C0_RALSL|nr:protein of unknown function [Ralstonia solanacearum]CUV36982.1 protein of unknown function [Ralstonia solanacearum]
MIAPLLWTIHHSSMEVSEWQTLTCTNDWSTNQT